MGEKVAEILLDIEGNFTELESVYNSLANKVTTRQEEISEDHEQWTSIYNTLSNHIENIKNIQTQTIEQYKKHKKVNEAQAEKISTLENEINHLKAAENNEIITEKNKPQTNPYKDFNQFFDELETLNKNQEKEWSKSKETSQMVIQNVLKMLPDSIIKCQQWQKLSQQLEEKENKMKELLNRIEQLKKESNEVTQLQNSSDSDKDQELNTLRTQVQQQTQINNENESEIERLQNELFVLNAKLKTQNDVTQSDKLNKEVKEEKLKNINANEKMKELNAENENLKDENKHFTEMINNLKQEMNGLQNEIDENKYGSQMIYDENENENGLKEKFEDILQILYYELQPDNQSLDSVESVKGAFEKWKDKQRQKIKNKNEKDSIKKLNKELKEKDETMKRLEKTNEHLEKENKHFNRMINNLNKEINELQNGNKCPVNINFWWVWLCWFAVWGSCIVVFIIVFLLMLYFGKWTI